MILDEMGGQQSTRRVTIVSEEATGVIKVGLLLTVTLT